MDQEEKQSAAASAKFYEDVRKMNEKHAAEMKAEAKRQEEHFKRNGEISSGISDNTGRQQHIRIMGDTNRKIQYLKSATK